MGWAPGWTALGHRGYSGYAWYRIRVAVSDPAAGGQRMALSGPASVDDAYQVFFNGALAGIPAREVGGDFYQFIPNDQDGSLLIVAGDVAGKGLQAGMLVAVLVGAIRTIAKTSQDPLMVLQTLNERLVGRGSYATCLALHIDSAGEATLANAGHLPPHLNGKAVAIDGSMPLGFLESAEFSVARFSVAEGDQLVMVSDGLAEAMDSEGRLFGFERVQSLVEARTPAAEIAQQVQKYGQEDDISVIAVTRLPLPVSA